MLHDPISPSSYVPQSLLPTTRYPLSFSLSVFPTPFASQSICSLVPLFPSLDIGHKWFHSLCSPKILARAHVPLHLLFLRPDLPQNFFQSPFSPKVFPSPCVAHCCLHSLYSQTYSHNPFVTQSSCSPKVLPVPMYPKHIPQSLCSPIPSFPSPYVPLKCFQSPKILPSLYAPQYLSSPVPCSPVPIDYMFPGAYVPQTSSRAPMFLSPCAPTTSSPVPMFLYFGMQWSPFL